MSKKYYVMCKTVLLKSLLEFCGITSNNRETKYLNNDLFQVMSAQLYITMTQGDGYLNPEEKELVRLFVQEKWDGTEEHFNELFNRSTYTKGYK